MPSSIIPQSGSPALPQFDIHERFPLDTVCEAAKILTGASDPVAAMPSVLNVLSSFMGLRMGALALLDDSGSGASGNGAGGNGVNPFAIAATTQGAASAPATSRAMPVGATRAVFRTGVALVSCDVASELGPDALPPQAPHDRFAFIAVPIREQVHSPYVIGVLGAWRDLTEDLYPNIDEDQRVMTMVAAILEQSVKFRRLVARDRERLMEEARLALRQANEKAAAEAPLPAEPIKGIIGDSPAIKSVIAQIRKVATTRTPVLLRGESGTGKELFARAVHALSDRKDKPFVKVNCAALSQTLLESELFGHEKGSFTGAMAQKKGRFELADKGTLFLDEIGEIGPEFQVKLLRILQEGEFERVGGTRTLRVDVRLVTATNRDLEAAVARGAFRADLYFRICVVPILLPPLRDRLEDVPQLAQAFLDRFNQQNGMNKRMTPQAVSALARCQFPGNVRELENCISRVAALSSGTEIGAQELACHQGTCLSAELWRMQTGEQSPIGGLAAAVRTPLPVIDSGTGQCPPAAACPAGFGEPPVAPPAGRPPAAFAPEPQDERARLIDAMERAGWVQAKAARLLGLTPRQIGYALKKHDIPLRKF
ncbi:Nif-specific regulatory protein [Rhodovulum sulfidophilum]|uniref:nif-specific transcriptional activator NifA n=1 Tax=Rhodovulum sulfidophilum TaxID=35806 RepID=UPI000697AF26|nr:nif-specific transcriptional activator NifA [Rhodovulum sulfidophilum]ANB35235.1 nif-specific transcriptional activator NifA [Rhodovulum sulfidophilum DSM 1374]ANB39057.1 nif-specific transcriptional activator NifA [Rhodovulum sulfidophilum]MCW2303940.1 Nif-specific regulatory protein [Rhodovulum sulfidophilum]